MNTAVDMDKTEKQATLIKTNEVLIKEGGNWFGLYSNPRVITLPKPEYSKEVLYWKPAIDRETCNAAIEQIRDHFAEGQTYQVNYTMLLQADFTGSTWDFFSVSRKLKITAQHILTWGALLRSAVYRFLNCSARSGI